MLITTRPWRLAAAAAMTAVAVTATVSQAGSAATAASAASKYGAAVPDIPCAKGSLPETTQGRAPKADYDSGRAKKGYTCNAKQVFHYGNFGGYRVERYVDTHGHECAFWDSTLLYPTNVPDQKTEGPGVYVWDMHDPAHPVHTDTLRTPAMQSPHESLRLNAKRGLLVADMGYPTWNPGFVDVYDVKQDCRHPALDSSSPMGVLGHESGFSPDGMTFYVASLYAHTISAVDLSDPKTPTLLWASFDYSPHGASISTDDNRLYMAENAFSDGFSGLTILDVSQIQKRVVNPQVSIVSRLTWKSVSTPQN